MVFCKVEEKQLQLARAIENIPQKCNQTHL